MPKIVFLLASIRFMFLGDIDPFFICIGTLAVCFAFSAIRIELAKMSMYFVHLRQTQKEREKNITGASKTHDRRNERG